MDFSGVSRKPKVDSEPVSQEQEMVTVEPKKEIPTVRAPMTLEQAKEQLSKKYLPDITKLEGQVSTHVIKDAGTAQQAVIMTAQVKELFNGLEEQRKEIIGKPDKFVRGVNSIAKVFKDRLEKMERDLKAKIGDFQYRQELARREADRKAQEETAKLQKQIDAEAKEKGVESVTVVAPMLPKAETTIRTETGKSSYTTYRWVGEITNENEVERQWCSPDQGKIDGGVKAGVREMKGIRIYEKATVGIR